MIEKTCVICGKQFQATSKTAKLCSNACRYKYQSLTRRGEDSWSWKGGPREKHCQHCGSLMKWKGQPLCLWQKRKFCSKRCVIEGQYRLRGPLHPRYNPNSAASQRKRLTGKQLQWSSKIIARDKATCRHCGATGIELHAHHLLSWKDHPEKRFDLDNGIALCHKCHWAVHTQQPMENPENSVEPLTRNGEGNTEPSRHRKMMEGVTTSGRAFRRVMMNCAWCGVEISKTLAQARRYKYSFCGNKCSAHHRMALRFPKAVNSATRTGRESEDIV